MFIEQIPIFQEHFFSYQTDNNFPGTLFVWSPNRYQFSRSTFLATEQIPIFQEAFFEYNEQIGNFQKDTPLRTDISTLGLGGCFRQLYIIKKNTKKQIRDTWWETCVDVDTMQVSIAMESKATTEKPYKEIIISIVVILNLEKSKII